MKRTHVSKREAASMLAVSVRTIERMVANGDLPCVRRLGCVRIPLRALRRLDKVPWPSKSVRALPAPQQAIALRKAPMLPEVIPPVAEVTAEGSADPIFEPFFRSQADYNEIRRRQTVPQQMKFRLYFAKYGCLCCSTMKRPHFAAGMCSNCYHVRLKRLQELVRAEQEELDKRGTSVVRDLTELARAALRNREEL
jgi:excisionase family DNA binding protein